MAAYQWKSGSRIKVSAQDAGEMCEKLAKVGNLTARSLLDLNRAEDAPLHNAFEWDDSVAAEEYRLSQARHIIACLIIKPEKKTETPVRCFYNIERNSPQYKSIGAILTDTDSTELLLNTALEELCAIQRKYAVLKRLTPVFDAIEQTKLDIENEGKEAEADFSDSLGMTEEGVKSA